MGQQIILGIPHSLRGQHPELLFLDEARKPSKGDSIHYARVTPATAAKLYLLCERVGDIFAWDGEADAVAALAGAIARGREIVEHRRMLAEHRGEPRAIPAKGPPVSVIEPWPHQAVAYDHAQVVRNPMLAMAMATGKTKVVCDIFLNDAPPLVLILCPLSVARVWRGELDKHAPGVVVPCDLTERQGTAAKYEALKKALARADEIAAAGKTLAVVVNYQAVWRAPLGAAILNLERKWDLIVADESHYLKTPSSKVSQFAVRLPAVSRRRVCLTGTPIGNTPLDLMPQYRFLDPGVYGRSFDAICNRYAAQDERFPSRRTLRYHSKEYLDAAGLLWFQCDRSVLQLPDSQIIPWPVALCKETRAVYQEMLQEMRAATRAGQITAANVMARTLRLHQITGGIASIKEDTGAVRCHTISNEKIEVVRTILDGTPPDEPIVVFARFTHDLSRLRELAHERGETYGEISGFRKDGIDEHGKLRRGVRLLGAQIAAGGVGIDLSAARIAVYTSLCHSLIEFEQSLARLPRPGTHGTVTLFLIEAVDTIDATIVKCLENKRDVAQSVYQFLKTGG